MKLKTKTIKKEKKNLSNSGLIYQICDSSHEIKINNFIESKRKKNNSIQY